MTTHNLQEELKSVRTLINQRLKTLIPVQEGPEKRVSQAMRYACIGQGKSIRPFLVLQGALLSGADKNIALDLACAVEMIHTYSLIHDDLPAMDNDVLRRGKPTCHIEFDEATAILAGDALLTKAFEVITQLDINADIKVKLISHLSKAIGHEGMIGGQMLDIIGEENSFDIATITRLQALKTGALICFSLLSGTMLGNISKQEYDDLQEYAQALGLLFQITDDLLDKHGNTLTLGKTPHKDEQSSKQTFLSLLGEEKTLLKADELVKKACDSLKIFPEDKTSMLKEFILFVRNRKS